MQLKFSGSVHFANGTPAPNVAVRIFDKDAPGKEDDDLTITPGLSDASGCFSLTYEPLRYLDYHTLHLFNTQNQPGDPANEETGMRIPDLGDMYLPYLSFNYTFCGLNYTSTASLGVFQNRFYLPEYPPVEFLPSTQGFHFQNCFSGYFLPFSTPAFMGSSKVTSNYGLCGGMCAAAYDFALAGRPIPDFTEVPKQGTRLQRYLFRRQMDSLGGLGREVIKVAQWTSLPDDTLLGTMRRTAEEIPGICQKLDQDNLVILALIYVHAASLKELSQVIFGNHQVLAYAYQQAPAGVIKINIYDPNLPGRDDVVLQAEPFAVGEETTDMGQKEILGMKSVELAAGVSYRDVRGFFSMPYTPVNPPQGL